MEYVKGNFECSPQALLASEPYRYYHDEPLLLNLVNEPTNIMWENKFFTETTKLLSISLARAILILGLLCAFCCFFIMQKQLQKIKTGFPDVDC